MNFDKETVQSLKEELLEQIQNIVGKAVENKEDVITLSPYDEPIKVAQKLILAVYEDEPSALEKAMGCTKPMLRAYYSPHELRQIAQHLLVYCDGAEDKEDEV